MIAEGVRFGVPEALGRVVCGEGCPFPPMEGSGQGAVPLLAIFKQNFWLKMGHFPFILRGA